MVAALELGRQRVVGQLAVVFAISTGIDRVVLGEGAECLRDGSLEAIVGSGDSVDRGTGAREGIAELGAEVEVLLREIVEVEQVGAEVNAPLTEVAEGKNQVGRELLLNSGGPGLIVAGFAEVALGVVDILAVQLTAVKAGVGGYVWNTVGSGVGDAGGEERAGIEQFAGGEGVRVVVDLADGGVASRHSTVDLLPLEDGSIEAAVSGGEDCLVIERTRCSGNAYARLDVLVVDVGVAGAEAVLSCAVACELQSSWGVGALRAGVDDVGVELGPEVVELLERKIDVVAKSEGQVEILVEFELILNVERAVLANVPDGDEILLDRGLSDLPEEEAGEAVSAVCGGGGGSGCLCPAEDSATAIHADEAGDGDRVTVLASDGEVVTALGQGDGVTDVVRVVGDL